MNRSGFAFASEVLLCVLVAGIVVTGGATASGEDRKATAPVARASVSAAAQSENPGLRIQRTQTSLTKALAQLPAPELPRSYRFLKSKAVTQAEAEQLVGVAAAAIYLADRQEVHFLLSSAADVNIEKLGMAANFSADAAGTLVSDERLPLIQRTEEVGVATLLHFVDVIAKDLPSSDAAQRVNFIVKLPSVIARPGDGASITDGPPLPVKTINGTDYYIYEDFEGDVWSRWQRGDNTGGQYTWAVTGCTSYLGSYSADPVRGGSTGALLTCNASYPPSIQTWMSYTLCATIPSSWNAWASAYLKGTIGMELDDKLAVYASDAQGKKYGYAFRGNYSGWFKVVFNLKQWYYLGDLTQENCNTVYLYFSSSSAAPAGPGPRVDDFRIDYGPTADTSGRCQILADPDTGQAPLTIAFRGVTDLTSGSYFWDFGDGSTSTQKDPAHVFTAAGTYDVYFRASDYYENGRASKRITVTSPPNCSYSLSATSQNFGFAGGTGSIGVVAPPGCAWTAASNAAWLTVTSGASGSGNGTVGYSVAANSGSARSGTLTIGGKTFTVSQDALICSYSISPSSTSVGQGGGSGSFGVTTLPGCPWTSTSDSSWLHVTSGASGSDNGSVAYSIDANDGGARAGHITVQGQIFTVSQASGNVALTFSHWIAAASHVDGAGSSHWRSDVGVLNRSSLQATVEYRLYTPDGLQTQQVALGGNAQDFRKDVASWLGFSSGSGPLEVRSDQDVLLMGRTYNQVDATHTYGQNYDGQEPGSGLLSAGQSAWLPLLAQNPSFRCNIAITNTGASTANVDLALYDGQGGLLWVGNAESSAIASGGFVQYLKPFQKYAGRNNLEHGYAKITVNSGSGIIVWASVVDEATGDPTTIFMKRDVGGPGNLLVGYPVAAGTSSLTNTPDAASSTTTTVFSDNFDGSFPGSWQVARLSGSANTEWGRVTCAGYGSTSAWCAAGGTAPQPPCSQYVGNMETWMLYGPFSLADATEAWAEFDLWLETETYNESSQKGDAIEWFISIDGTNIDGSYTSGTSNGWVHKVLNFRDVTSIAAVGSPNVWFGFYFLSDSSVHGRGAYVDNVVIKKTVASSCSYSISPTSASVAAAGTNGSFSVTTGAGCAWTASSDSSWLTVTGFTGNDSGTVSYSVATNGGAARVGHITVQGQTFTVNQGGVGCTYSISPTQESFSSLGGVGTVSVSAGVGCGWSSVSNASWITITSGSSGSGYGNVGYLVAANGGPARSGTMTIAGRTATITQSPLATLSFGHWIAAASHVDGLGSSHWRSDVAVLNRSSSQATIEYRLHTPGGLQTQQVVLGGNAQDFRKDVAAWLGYWVGSGPLEVRSDQDVFVMGRTYNQVDATHSYGQNYDGQEPDSSLLSAGQSAWLPVLAQNQTFRCNIAITNTGATTANVTLALYDGQGNLLWSGNNESAAMASGSFVQYLTPFEKYARRVDLEHAYARVTVNSGSGIIVWASVVDNATGDPTTIFMKR